MNIKTKNKLETHIRLGVTADQKSEVERIALKRDMSQQKVLRMMIDVGLECHRDMEKLGIIRAVDFAYYVKKALNERMSQNGKRQLEII